MPKSKNDITVLWAKDVDERHYAAAKSYLSLIYPLAHVSDIIEQMRVAPLTAFLAKDIFRASQLSLLGISNNQVEKNRNKIAEGEPLFPILLLRDTANGKVVIADGYHRLCAIYGLDENEAIHCKIV